MKNLKEINVSGKKVLVRVDFNVPFVDGEISDVNRIKAALPTINYLVEAGGRVILLSHLGKVKSEEDKASKSLGKVAEKLELLLGKKVLFVGETRGANLEDAAGGLKDGDVMMIENTRFEDLNNKAESKNDPELGKYWASLGDGIFVNDAFGTAHRAHASNVGIASNCEVVAPGFLLEKEIKFIGGVVKNPELPLVAILGGSKVSDKILLIENILKNASNVLIGGGMTFTFLKAQGYEVGNSLVEEDQVEYAKKLLDMAAGKIILPTDIVWASEFANDADIKVTEISDAPSGMMGLDVGPKTIENFGSYIQSAKTVVWNGPMGVFEMSNFAAGTRGVCETIAVNKNATTIIGGGDSAAAAIQMGFEDGFTHISTGGGSSLEYLEGKDLPGITCLEK